MRPDHPHYETIQQVNRQLRHMWVHWGLFPLGVAFVLMVIMSLLRPAEQVTQPEQLALGFKGVMAAGAALFLIGFWLDGRWTEAQRLARMVYQAAGGDRFKPSKSQLAQQELALSLDKVQRQLGGATPRKVIVVPDRLVNIVA